VVISSALLGTVAAQANHHVAADAKRTEVGSPKSNVDESTPALSASFDGMDVNDDDKLTRGEFRTWHESRKARMDADPGAARSTTDDKAPNSPTPPGDTGD
jgi:hypothetical protein